MKRIFCLVLLAATLAFAASVPAAAQQNKQQCDSFVEIVNKDLPMDMGGGFIWTRVSVEDNYSVTVFTFKFIGTEKISPQDMKDSFKNLTPAEAKKLFGDDFDEIYKTLGTKGRVVLTFDDGTRFSFDID